MPAPVLKAFTDYPIEGHTGIIEVEVLAFDRNKYATVRIGDIVEDVKRCYLCRDPALTRPLDLVRLYQLPQEVGEPAEPRAQVFRTLKHERRRRTDYILWVGDTRHAYKTLDAALRHMARVSRTETCLLRRCRSMNYGFSSEGLVENGPEGYFIMTGTKRSRNSIKTRHYKKYFKPKA